MARKHDVRLAILAALQQRRTVPQTLDALAGCLLMAEAGVSRAEIMDELAGLLGHGYVVNHIPGRGYLLGLTARGMDQVTRDAALDEYIHGDAAYIGRTPNG
jgi:biotin operon repressor